MPKGDPTKTFKRGVFFAFVLVSLLYLLANVAYVCETRENYQAITDFHSFLR